jgi:hypothetical protein
LSTDVVVALVGVGGVVLGGVVGLYGQARSASQARRREAEAVLAKYQEPLVHAAYELQSRLYNILELSFLQKYYIRGDEGQRDYAIRNTVYVVGQYFGWSEILRREIQFLSYSDSNKTRVVAECQREIVEMFQSDKDHLGRPFQIWRGEQRAIGELMIDPDATPVQCIGYAAFAQNQRPASLAWFKRLEADIEEIATNPNRRLIELQHALVDLVRELDQDKIRYPDEELGKVDLARQTGSMLSTSRRQPRGKAPA